MTLKDRIEEVMAAKNWQVHHVAEIGKVTSAAVSQWLGRGGKKQTKSIGDSEVALRLEKASGFSARWLAKGIGPKHHSESIRENASERVDSVTTITAGGQNSDERDVASAEIPTSMNYSAPNLKSAILLMGSLLGALDARSKTIIGEMLKDLALHTDDAEDIANKAAALATTQKPISKDARLNKALTKQGAPETEPANLR